ncbi:MAG: DUF3055 domain-containing protein [Hydrogenibacillus schlegelii]|nr:DUF3055 domain-containing protein [Hydrogenibacillus schlegelii]
MVQRQFLYDEDITADVRFVSFFDETGRFDLAIVKTDRFFGKRLVLDMQRNRFAILGEDDLAEPGLLEDAFGLDAEAAAALRSFLEDVIA